MDESDRLTQFIEDRAKDTLLRFARKRQERQSNGQINSLMASIGPLGTPRRVSSSQGLFLGCVSRLIVFVQPASRLGLTCRSVVPLPPPPYL